MSETELLTANHDRRIEALENLIPAAALDLIYKDPHQWSDRPCGTCRTVSALIGQPFGCDRRRVERNK